MDRLTNTEIIRARMQAGDLDPAEALLARKRYPELQSSLIQYRAYVPAKWNIQVAVPYRWIDPIWFDRQVLDNVKSIGREGLLCCSDWLRVITTPVKIELIEWLVNDLPENFRDKEEYSRICSLMITIAEIQGISLLAELLLSKLFITNRIVTAISFYVEKVITEMQLEALVQRDIENLSSWTEMYQMKYFLHELPEWLVQKFISSPDIRIDAEIIESVSSYKTLKWSNLEKFNASAIAYLLRVDHSQDCRFPELCNDRNKLLDYEQLCSTRYLTDGLMQWLARCDPANELHRKILKHKLPTLICRFDWESYGELIDLEWLAESENIETIASCYHRRADRTRIIAVCKKIADNPHLLAKLDPIPIMMRVYPRLPALIIVNTMRTINAQPGRYLVLKNRNFREGIPQYILELICDVYGCREIPEQSDKIIWDGGDALALWRTIPPNSGTLQFMNGGAYDAGGVSREFHARLGESLRPLTRELDGYRVPISNGALWGSVIRRSVLWDRQSIEIDMHPIVCVLMCWSWLLQPSEPYPYAVIAALLDRDVLSVLAPATAYRIQEACMDPESSMQPCIELSGEIHERYLSDPLLLANLCAMMHTAGAPLDISPRRLFRMLSGGSSMNLTELFAVLEIRIYNANPNIDDQTEHPLKNQYREAFSGYLHSMQAEELEEFYRFWFGTIRPSFSNEVPVLNIVSEMPYPVAKSHVCVSQLNLPQPNDISTIIHHIQICIERAIGNQRIAMITGMLYQFR